MNSWDNKKPNFSSVAYLKYNGVYQFVDTLFNKALSKYENGIERYDGSISDGTLRQEEQMIYRIVNQYSSPSLILNFTLRNDNKIYGLYGDYSIKGRKFIVDSISTDYRFNKQELRLVEKKSGDYISDGTDNGFTYNLTAQLS